MIYAIALLILVVSMGLTNIVDSLPHLGPGILPWWAWLGLGLGVLSWLTHDP